MVLSPDHRPDTLVFCRTRPVGRRPRWFRPGCPGMFSPVHLPDTLVVSCRPLGNGKPDPQANSVTNIYCGARVSASGTSQDALGCSPQFTFRASRPSCPLSQGERFCEGKPDAKNGNLFEKSGVARKLFPLRVLEQGMSTAWIWDRGAERGKTGVMCRRGRAQARRPEWVAPGDWRNRSRTRPMHRLVVAVTRATWTQGISPWVHQVIETAGAILRCIPDRFVRVRVGNRALGA